MTTCPIVKLNRLKPRKMGIKYPDGGIENRRAYLNRAHRFCAVVRKKLEDTGEYRHCHESFLIRDVLLNVEAVFVDLGTCGVDYIPSGSDNRSPEITYLNSGDPYDSTLLYVNGRFRLGCWGDIVERGNYE